MSVADPAAARRNQVPRGIMYMVASTVAFAGGNAIVKWELAFYPIGETAFFRALFDPPDASHQYYRRSPKVRADVAAVMSKNAGVRGGLVTL